jgi:rare lipoprotein A
MASLQDHKPPRSISPSLVVAMIATVFSLALSGCATSRATGPSPPSEPARAPTPGEIGEASWYGKAHHGKPTASGETYDMHELTAAHPTLPLGTRVLVTNLENGRSVQVRINDRGPTVKGRIIDLSYAAARRLGAIENGTIPVQVRVLSLPPP